MELLLSFSQATGIYSFMNSTWGWPFIESLHFLGLSLLIGTVGVFDLRMLGIAKGVSMAALHRLVPFGVAGYCLNVITGIMFVSTAPDQYLFNPAFQTKLTLMFIAGLNMLYFYQSSLTAVIKLPPESKAPTKAMILGAISLLCWTGVIVGGRLITYFRPPYHWCLWC